MNAARIALFLLALSLWNPIAISEDSPSGNLNYIKGRQRYLDGKYDEALEYLEKALAAEPENPYLNHQLADVHLRLGNYDRAEVLAKKAVDKEPSNLEYRALLGGIYASNKKYPEAKEQYARVQEMDPTNNKVPLLLGLLEAESGNGDKAIEVLSGAAEEGADPTMGLFYRAKVYIEMGKLDKAKADLEKCLSLRPSFVDAGTALGLIQERLNESEGAINTYLKIRGNGRFKKRLAQLLLQKGDLARALETLLEYEKSEPDDYTARVKVGLIYFEQKQYPKALERFEGIIKEQPQADNVRFYLGATLEEMKEYSKALAQFQKVSKDSSFFKESMLHSGLLYKEMGKLKEGLQFAKKIRQKHSDIPEFFDLEASLWEVEKNYTSALQVIEQGLQKFPKEEKLLYFQGSLYDRLGQKDKAIANMKAIVAQNANNAHALNFLGYTYAEMGTHLTEAEEYVTRAMVLRPNDGYIEDSLGWILYKQGRIDEAITRLESAVKLQPEETVILEHLGDAYLKKKDFAKASAYYQKALASSDKKDKELSKKLQSKLTELAQEKRNPTASGGNEPTAPLPH